MLSTSVVFSVLLAVAAAQSLMPGSFPDTCAATLCAVGHHCVLKEEPCDNPPCLSQPVCVPDTPSKQGVCHKPMFSLPSWLCRSRCESDVECPGAQKCCPSYCGSRCQDPQPAPLPRSGLTCEPPCAAGYHCVLKDEPCDNPRCLSQPVCVPVTPSKDGVCPKPGATDGDNCTSTCQQDSDCDGRDKCCEVSCGATECQTPVGLTSVRSRHSTCARMHCLPDHFCVLRMECYGRGCKSNSLKPYCEKPGQCRKPRPFEAGICANTCTRDSDCEGSDKCCKNGCGATVCQSVEGQTLVRPQPTCDTVKCKAGHKCVMRVIYCVNTPCPSPFPECVPDPDKQGVCPKPRFSLSSWFCRSRCQSDVECPGAQKCCPSYCGSCCQDPKPAPLPKPGQTCKTVDCGPDQECVMKRQCGKLGCSSRPECEPVKRCPFFPAWINPHCVRKDTCSENDPNSCFPGQICCSTDCGRRCVRPMQ